MSVSTSPEEATPGVGGFAVYDLRGSGSNSSAILEFSFSPPVVGSTAGGGSDALGGGGGNLSDSALFRRISTILLAGGHRKLKVSTEHQQR